MFASVLLVPKKRCKRSLLVRLLMRRRTRLNFFDFAIFSKTLLSDHLLEFPISTNFSNYLLTYLANFDAYYDKFLLLANHLLFFKNASFRLLFGVPDIRTLSVNTSNRLVPIPTLSLNVKRIQ